MSSIFDLIEEFEKEENEKNLLSSFNKQTFLNGFYAGQYSILYDMNKDNVSYNGWFFRNESIQIAISEGLNPQMEALSLALSETTLSNTNKNTRSAIDIYNSLKMEFQSINKKETLHIDYMNRLFKNMFQYTIGGNIQSKDFESQSKIFIELYEKSKEKEDGVSIFLRDLLNNRYKENFIIPQRLGRIMAIRLLKEVNPIMRPIPIGQTLRISNKKYQIALDSNTEVWNNFLFESINENAQYYIKKQREIRNLRSKFNLIDDSKRNTSKIPQIIDYLFEFPIFDNNKLKNDFNLTSPGVIKILDKLTHKGIIRTIGNKKRNSKYICDDILRV